MRALLVMGWLATLVVLLWDVRRTTSGDLAVVIGVLCIWAVDLGTAVCYVLLVVRPPQDPEVWTYHLQSCVREFHRPLVIAFLVAPGVWIGWAARSPLLAAAASLLIMEALFLLSTALDRGPDPLPIPRRIVLFRDRAVMLMTAVLAGAALRALLRL
jgi:hypothetical protein